MKKAHGQSGQATVLTLVFLTVLLGMGALVLDLGAWFRADRATQSTADAAALAGAQALPDDTGKANGLALDYAGKNGGGLSTGDVTFSSSLGANDTINVHVERSAGGVFTRLFGIDSVKVGSKASARTALISQAKYVAPIVVKNTHTKLFPAGCPCFGNGNRTTLALGPTGAPGAFALINLDGTRGGTSPEVLAEWMLKGYDGYLSLGGYFNDPGAKFNSSHIQNALQQRLGTELLFPVYDELTGNGANAQYHVIGWVGFHLESFDARGNSGSISGYFTQVIWSGLQATSGQQPPNYGARSVQLID